MMAYAGSAGEEQRGDVGSGSVARHRCSALAAYSVDDSVCGEDDAVHRQADSSRLIGQLQATIEWRRSVR